MLRAFIISEVVILSIFQGLYFREANNSETCRMSVRSPKINYIHIRILGGAWGGG